jgi:DNA-binding CsgD family transcriptional regulator
MASAVAVQGRGVPRADFIEKRFDLTPAQARLVSHLVAGVSLRSSAEVLGVKYETARTYLRSVFEKTGTHRQTELVLTVFRAMSHHNRPAVTDSGGQRRLPSISV